MLAKQIQRGFSLIELLVALVIVGTLFALAVPNFRVWIQNQQTRTAAESILNGIQLARSEAVKNNGAARFVLCALPDSSWEVLVASAAAAVAPPPSLVCGAGSDAGVGEVRVQERSGQEGSRNVVVGSTPAGLTSVTFSNIGRVVGPTVTFDVSAPNGGDRPLNIAVGVGGIVRMCDPSPYLALTDPRSCH